MCRVMSVSRSGFYEWLYRPISKRNKDDQALKVKIKEIHIDNYMNTGTRRIKSHLADHGDNVSRKRIGRLMAEEGLICKTKKKFKATTNSDHGKPVAENILAREFQKDQLNEAYVGDITYISTREGWLYLSVFIDLCSRTVVGWSMNKRMTATLVTDSLQMAIKGRKPKSGLLIHSDQGSQYASAQYQQLLSDNSFICSMSRRGNCWDNAVAESFFHTLKTELTYHEDFETRDEAQQAIFKYIEAYYNPKRKHSSNGYMAPLEYEQVLAKAA